MTRGRLPSGHDRGLRGGEAHPRTHHRCRGAAARPDRVRWLRLARGRLPRRPRRPPRRRPAPTEKFQPRPADFREIKALLARRARALMHHDRSAFLATVDHRQPALLEAAADALRQRRAAPPGLAELRHRHLGGAGTGGRPGGRPAAPPDGGGAPEAGRHLRPARLQPRRRDVRTARRALAARLGERGEGGGPLRHAPGAAVVRGAHRRRARRRDDGAASTGPRPRTSPGSPPPSRTTSRTTRSSSAYRRRRRSSSTPPRTG